MNMENIVYCVTLLIGIAFSFFGIADSIGLLIMALINLPIAFMDIVNAVGMIIIGVMIMFTVEQLWIVNDLYHK